MFAKSASTGKLAIFGTSATEGDTLSADCILIDDLDQNILAWEEIGGTGILHTSVQETFAALEKLCVLSGGRKR